MRLADEAHEGLFQVAAAGLDAGCGKHLVLPALGEQLAVGDEDDLVAALGLIHLISIPISNTSVNPARSTAVAFFNGNGAPGQLWLFWVAPIVGAIIAGFSYEAITGIDASAEDIDGQLQA